MAEAKFPYCFVYCESVSFFDYVPHGVWPPWPEKLHGKKNHCNRFEAENNWDFVPLTGNLFPTASKCSPWTEENADRLSDGIADRHDAIVHGLKNFEELGLLGGVPASTAG